MQLIINIMHGDESDYDLKEIKDDEGEEKLKLLPNLQSFFCNDVKAENPFGDGLTM